MPTHWPELVRLRKRCQCWKKPWRLRRRYDERLWEANSTKLKGELLLAQSADNHAAAETCFERAVDLARRQSARMWELGAAISLARLRKSRGKTNEARDTLAPIYGWFTEGSDTAELKEAKALLEELS